MAKFLFTAAFCVVLVALAAPLSLAQDSQAIFNGKNLSGWKVKGAKARARNGVMTLERANGWVYYDKTPKHFVLSLELRLLREDSKIAVLVRAVPNGDDDSVPNYATRITLGPVDAARSAQPLSWHRLEIECSGFTIKATLDDAEVYKNDDVMFDGGEFGLAALEGSAEFRNVQLTEAMPADPIARADGVYMLHKRIETPRVARRVDPVYPRAAGNARIEGEVWVAAIVLTSGDVGDVRLIRSIPALDQAAIEATKQWKFEPATLDGAPVPVLVTIAIEFSIRER